MEKVFLNDRLVDIDKAAVPVTDSGLLYGMGLFETMRSYNGVVFRLDDHLDRLSASAKSLAINNTCDKKFISDAVYQLLDANKLTDARMRLTLTSGPMSLPDEQRKPALVITAAKLQPYPPEYYNNGVLVVLSPCRQNPDDPACGHKTINYLSRMLTLQLAHQKRAAEALWFTTDSRLAEGCISNIFLVKDSILYTPPLQIPVLPGIARKTVCQIAPENSIELVEKDLYIDDLLAADEAFLTNVIMQILPITRIEKHTVGDGKAGPVTKKLQQLYEDFIKSHCSRKK